MQELYVGNKSALVLEQIRKKLELLGREVDFLVGLPERMAIETHFQIAGQQDLPGMRSAWDLDFGQTGQARAIRAAVSNNLLESACARSGFLGREGR